MSKIIVLLLFGFLGVTLSAQDIITKKDRTTLDVKVLTATPEGVKYKISSEYNGPVYFISSDDFIKIQYKKALRPNMKYSELRRMYRTKNYMHYENAAYQPGLMGIASFLVPGLGACLADEWARGLPCFVGTSLLGGIAYDMYTNGAPNYALCAMAGGVALWIWSIVDAVNISKVKNMYIHDYMKMYGANITIMPSFSCVKMNDSTIPTAGFNTFFKFLVMKKVLLIALFVCISFCAFAQKMPESKEGLVPGMKYEYLKKIYKPKDYSKYPDVWGESLFSVGLTSLILPGLGDCLVDEGLRGFIKFGSACALVGADLILNAYNKEYAMYFGFGIIGYWMWNVVDSIRVAMVKNMYFNDLYNNYGIRFNIAPTFNPILTPSGVAPSAGLALSLSF